LRRLAAILLLGILFFNSVGYRALNGYMQHHASLEMESQLDRRQYNSSQLISIKVPATHLSYYNSSLNFERVDGQIEINGVLCQYVERRLYNDSLELLCIPNHTVTKLRMTGKDHFKLIVDVEQSPDYYIVTTLYQIKERSYTRVCQRPSYQVFIPSAFPSAEDRPPDVRG